MPQKRTKEPTLAANATSPSLLILFLARRSRSILPRRLLRRPRVCPRPPCCSSVEDLAAGVGEVSQQEDDDAGRRACSPQGREEQRRRRTFA